MAIEESSVAAVSAGPTALSIASVTEAVYERMRSQILNDMAPRQPIRLNEIAMALGVSTTPVRVAVERLAADGLVVQEGRKGATVAPLSLMDFLDIYAVRRGLEGESAARGAPRLSDGDLSQMTQLLQHLDEIGKGGAPEVDDYLRLEWKMHELCYQASILPRLNKEIDGYRRQAERYFRLVLLDEVNLREDLEHQRAFYASCLSRDGEAAASVARALLDWTVERVAPRLKELGS